MGAAAGREAEGLRKRAAMKLMSERCGLLRRGGVQKRRMRAAAGDQGLMSVGAGLEDTDQFKGPRFNLGRRNCPIGMSRDDFVGVAEIRGVVGAETKAGALPCFGGEFAEELGLDDAVFPVAALGPGVGE